MRMAADEWAQRDDVTIRAARDDQAVVRFAATRDAATNARTHSRTRSITARSARMADRQAKRTT
jgi:hypothetical protein